MRHIRAIKRFAKSPLFIYYDELKSFIFTNLMCSLQAYDRFISDRTFGTKKRILLIPGPHRLPAGAEYVRSGPGMARYMVDAIDEDMYAQDPHLTCYLLRESAYPVQILYMESVTRANGRSGPAVLTLVDDVTRWGDYERYTASNGREDMEEVSNSIIDVFLPLSAPVDSDKYIAIDNKVIQVREVTRVSNLLMVRGVKQDIDYPPAINQRAYACDMAIDSIAPALRLPDSDVQSYGWESLGMCNCLTFPVSADFDVGRLVVYGAQGDVAYPDDYFDEKFRMQLYKADGTLLATSLTGRMDVTLTEAGNKDFYVSLVPQYHTEPFTTAIHVKGYPFP